MDKCLARRCAQPFELGDGARELELELALIADDGGACSLRAACCRLASSIACSICTRGSASVSSVPDRNATA